MEKLRQISSKPKRWIKNHKKIAIGIIALLLVLVIASVVKGLLGSDAQSVPSGEVATVIKKDLVNSVSETGQVAAVNSVDVFAEKQLPVAEINVKEGQKVSAGDVICTLDSSSIRQQIATKEASASANKKTVGAQISAAKARLSEAIRGKTEGTNAALVSANNSVSSAFDAWQSAEKTYNDYKKSIDERYHPEIVAEKSTRQNLSYAEESGALKYQQLQDDFSKNLNDARANRDMAASKNAEKDSLRADMDNLERRATELSIQSSDLQAKMSEVPLHDPQINNIDRQLRDIEMKLGASSGANAPKPNGNNSANGNTAIPPAPSTSGESLQELMDRKAKLETEKQDIIRSRQESIRNQINNITRMQNELKQQSQQLQEAYTKAQSDFAEYETKAKSLEKELETQTKTIEQSKVDMEKARQDIQSNEDTAMKNAKAREDQLKTLRQNADNAHNTYLAAIESLDSAKKQVDNEINTLRDSVKTAGAAQNNVDQVDLKYLAEDLEKTVIKAPTDGTVTKLSAKEGMVPTEAVAKIETVQSLKIESHVKEFNVKQIKAGTKVVVTSDSIEGKEFDGKVLSVSPTPEDKKQGDTSTDVLYKSTIELQAKDMENFTPGMTVRVKYILSEEQNTFTVPTTAIFQRDNKDYVLALVGDGEEKQVKKVEVVQGMSNDFETAVQGKDIKENLSVLSNPAGYSEGQVLKVTKAPAEQDGKESGS